MLSTAVRLTQAEVYLFELGKYEGKLPELHRYLKSTTLGSEPGSLTFSETSEIRLPALISKNSQKTRIPKWPLKPSWHCEN